MLIELVPGQIDGCGLAPAQKGRDPIERDPLRPLGSGREAFKVTKCRVAVRCDRLTDGRDRSFCGGDRSLPTNPSEKLRFHNQLYYTWM